jgi:hypothetical protein
MKVRLAYFIDIPGRGLYPKPVITEIVGGGPSTAKFSLSGERITSEELQQLVSNLPDAQIQGYRSLHVLALAERTLRIFERQLKRPLRWRYPRVALAPHGQEVPAFVLDNEFATYAPSQRSSVIRFQFLQAGPYACLSHDICVHETVHALLHGDKGWLDADPSTRAVTEAVGDVCAMLSTAAHQEIRATL